jgi:uncharacterized phiE125 gp8 family phage protein
MLLSRFDRVDARPVHVVVTPPASPGLAVTVAEAREHLGYGTEVDAARDAELTAFIKAAQSAIEQYCELTLLTTVVKAEYREFSDLTSLVKRPYQSFGKIEYVQASDGEIVETDTSVYHVTLGHQFTGQVTRGSDTSWPTDVAVRSNAVRMTYTVGWATNAIPFDVKLAILMTVAKFDANRGDCEDGGGASVYAMKNSNASALPSAAVALLAPYKLARAVFV